MSEEMTREHYETYHGPNRIGTYTCHIFVLYYVVFHLN